MLRVSQLSTGRRRVEVIAGDTDNQRLRRGEDSGMRETAVDDDDDDGREGESVEDEEISEGEW